MFGLQHLLLCIHYNLNERLNNNTKFSHLLALTVAECTGVGGDVGGLLFERNDGKETTSLGTDDDLKDPYV